MTVSNENKQQQHQPTEIFRKDYKALIYHIANVSMKFEILEEKTFVHSCLDIEGGGGSGEELTLDGDSSSVKLIFISVDGNELVEGNDYSVYPEKLVLHNPPSAGEFKLETVVEIHPELNTELTGLYRSSGVYCTQCEATGFRRITYFLDRPDNMSIYEVRLEADKDTCPVLLSNGNLVQSGDLDDHRHFAVWHDPYPKPCYLFALVSGRLSKISSSFTTQSGRDVQLDIYSEPANVGQLSFAMDSLKKSMKWDEERYGLEYDLDLFNIVAVNDFNMGAMENKSLNVFNTSCVLTSPQTSTDADYQNVLRIIGHEYFHNWTGNRVTCKDWFQLTLKEGLTVFRDQEFSSDYMDSPCVKRIADVNMLRGRQFPEDAGPMKHPIRPESYISMDNFYTATVYVKGAEIIRMYQTLLGKDGFRKGMDLYFKRHDGCAVTCDDFRMAMADANNVDLTQFAKWYSTPGTPTVHYTTNYDNKTLSLTFAQTSMSTEGPLHIPIAVGVLNKDTGEEIVPTTILQLKEETQTFTFQNLNADIVVPSILRNFSAPIKLISNDDEETQQERCSFLAAYDTDGFNQWEAGQKLYTSAIFKAMQGDLSQNTIDAVAQAFQNTLSQSSTAGYSISAMALTLPSEKELGEQMPPPVDPVAIRKGRKNVRELLARTFYGDILGTYRNLTEKHQQYANTKGEFEYNPTAMGLRSLRNVLLNYLCSISSSPEEQVKAAQLAWSHFAQATGMTDKMSAFRNLVNMSPELPQRAKAIHEFYTEANDDPLVINKWFTVQALADVPNILDQIKLLTKHPEFSLSNPNRCRSLLSAFTMNEASFHCPSGNGYRFLGDMIAKVDKLNPKVSSRMATNLIRWRKFDDKRGMIMKEELEKLKDMEGISDDLFEIVSRGLQ